MAHLGFTAHRLNLISKVKAHVYKKNVNWRSGWPNLWEPWELFYGFRYHTGSCVTCRWVQWEEYNENVSYYYSDELTNEFIIDYVLINLFVWLILRQLNVKKNIYIYSEKITLILNPPTDETDLEQKYCWTLLQHKQYLILTYRQFCFPQKQQQRSQ